MMKQLIQTKCPASVWGILVCALTLHSGCREKSYGSPEGYDMNKPQVMQLGKVLNEISGLAYTEDNNLLAISDSKEKIFKIDLKNKKLKDLTDKVVGPDNDLEDLVKVEDTIYLLSSWGEIKSLSLRKKDSILHVYNLGLTGQNDFETLYYDPTAHGLVMICKTCAHEKGKGIRTAYRFDLRTKTFDSTAFFTINKKDIEDLLKDKDAHFDPSGAAISPIDKRLYILSSASNLLAVADTRGDVIEVYKLNPDKFPQAEGIAFAPNGDMYISNEGKYGRPTLLYFRYHPGSKHK
jgi:uncharacterized protein YjiK